MSPSHRQATSALLVVAGLATGGLALRHRSPAASAGTDDDLPVRRAPAVMPAAERLSWGPVPDGDAPTEVIDFTRLGDTLIVLDGRAGRVLLLRPAADGWRTIGGWGRRGGGPGEFQRASALALTSAGEVAVLEEGGRIQLFDLTGRALRAERAALPCVTRRPTLAYGPGRVRWVASDCAGPGAARDTLFTFLFRADGDGDYREVRRLPRMAVDLSWGSLLGTRHPLADAGDGVWFGTGQDDCAWLVPGAESPDAAAAPVRRCGLVRERLRSPPPPDLERQRRDAEQRGQHQLARLLRWPDALPPFIALLDGGDELLLARPLNGDSLAMVPADAPFDASRARLVAPLVSFVTCTRGACLWYDREGRLALYDPRGPSGARR